LGQLGEFWGSAGETRCARGDLSMWRFTCREPGDTALVDEENREVRGYLLPQVVVEDKAIQECQQIQLVSEVRRFKRHVQRVTAEYSRRKHGGDHRALVGRPANGSVSNPEALIGKLLPLVNGPT